MGSTMDAERRRTLTSVKGSLVRHPAVIGASTAALVALLASNIVAFMRGMESPWLFGVTILADMVVIGVAIVIGAREVLVAEQRTEASQARPPPPPASPAGPSTPRG